MQQRRHPSILDGCLFALMVLLRMRSFGSDTTPVPFEFDPSWLGRRKPFSSDEGSNDRLHQLELITCLGESRGSVRREWTFRSSAPAPTGRRTSPSASSYCPTALSFRPSRMSAQSGGLTPAGRLRLITLGRDDKPKCSGISLILSPLGCQCTASSRWKPAESVTLHRSHCAICHGLSHCRFDNRL